MRKTIKNAVFILLVLTLSVSTALLAYLHFSASDDKDLSGEWTANIDMTEQAAVTAFSWLQDIEGVSVSYKEIESYMQELTVQVNLTFEQTERSAGIFRCNISTESYEACNQAVYAAFASVFQELLTERLRMTDYAGSTDKEAIEALVTETFGMSTVSYLMSYGPTLLPSLEDLQAEYDGSGTYEITDDILTRQFEVGGSVPTKAEYYIRKESNLILSEEIDSVSDGPLLDYYPMIYTLRQTLDQ
ncbi:MAG: hypothetical protein HDR09_22140 [Lachnospiraceae bacterium]|nr:hypothetical protein [Lachnospiraceae bacterium]